MRHNAALLIDLENFYLAREALFGGRRYPFRADLEQLSTFVKAEARECRLIVQRAYANFNVCRVQPPNRDYYLQRLPVELMDFGIEPIQVFPFRQGTNKNAVDMRLAMDATTLVSTKSPVEHFILVTGDSDFIPVVVELKRHGPRVTVIGVEGSTSSLFARYCDSFEYFEDLLAAQELGLDDRSAKELDEVGRSLQDLLQQHPTIKFAAVKPLLTRQLGRTFDPTVFRCENTGDFLRQYADELNVQVRKGECDWEVLPPSPAPAKSDSGATPVAPKQAVSPARAAAGREVEFYKGLLKSTKPALYIVPPADWRRVTDLAYQELAPSAAPEGAPFHYRDVQDRLIEQAGRAGVPFPDRKVPSVMFQLYAAACFVSSHPEDGSLQTEFHWDRPARLHPDIHSEGVLRDKVCRYVIRLLESRGKARDPSFSLKFEALGTLLLDHDPSPDELRELEHLADEARAASRLLHRS